MNKPIAVLLSGTGSLTVAMIQAGLPISIVIADRPCEGLEKAWNLGVPTAMIDRRHHGYGTPRGINRESFTAEVALALRERGTKLALMAGFMTFLSPNIFVHYQNRLLNSHPSLLPLFKGERAVQDALDAGVTETGTTIHVATEVLDEGPILAQVRVPVHEGDTKSTLWERIKVVERELYPKVAMQYLETLG